MSAHKIINRETFDIVFDVLTTCRAPSCLTTVMHKAGMGHRNAKSMVEFLETEGLIMHERGLDASRPNLVAYVITTKGLRWMQLANDLKTELSVEAGEPLFGRFRTRMQQILLQTYGYKRVNA